MGKIQSLGAIAALALVNIHVSWAHFTSWTYPYTITQPSSFRHVVLQNTDRHKADYFFPSLGSYTTNVNIYADAPRGQWNEKAYLQSIGGRHIRRSGFVWIMGRKMPLMRADFASLIGNWTIEQVTFTSGGLLWHLTMSYAARYRRMRPLMLHMLHSFHTRSPAGHRP